MQRLSKGPWIWPIAFLSVVAVFAAAGTAQGQDTTVRLEVPREHLKVGGQPFSVSVAVDDVTNLGAFEFELTYDPNIVEIKDVQEGPFLGSSGRPVTCFPPRRAVGSTAFTCVTLGATPDGPAGSGALATLTFQPVGVGTSLLHFARLTLTDPPANRLAAEAEDTSLTVGQMQAGNFHWALWGPVIGIGALVAGAAAVSAAWWARRSRGA